MKRLLPGAILFGVLAIVPAATVSAQDHPVAKTYYDKTHKDTHAWNDNEATAWGHYREDHHVKEVEFAQSTKKQQQDYWNWRHEHPDTH